MSLISTSQKAFDLTRNTIHLNSKQCAYSIDKFATCQACFDICPENAIVPGKPPTLNEEGCKNCLACLPACPVGAIQGKDAVSAILNCALRLQGGNVDLLCERHPNPSLGVDKTYTGLQIRGCLAGLGVGALVEFAMCDLKKVSLRLDGCKDCIWGDLQKIIREQYKTAEEFLNIFNIKQNIECVSVLNTKTKRPYWHAESPPISRRNLFKSVTEQSRVSFLNSHTSNHDEHQKHIGRNNFRLSKVANHLLRPIKENTLLPSTLRMSSVTVNSVCIACGACARICPTGALHFIKKQKTATFDLSLTPSLCIGCEACTHICPANAIEVNHHPSTNEIFNGNKRISLATGNLQACEKCRALFAGKPGEELCPICIARRQRPFGGDAR